MFDFRKFGLLCFLVTSVLRFAPLPSYGQGVVRTLSNIYDGAFLWKLLTHFRSMFHLWMNQVVGFY